ncbi:Zinc finger, RING-type [Corchorus olitorius]|uniref:RING-type E3 ubiquitin transferase n=1 Tax=Corchorus olitorius TaxID=93759 RepID=A0A1R3IIQ7_9ROSI|nr:Zinc finger, RING-type [Corchorus olitorius]
MASIFLFPHKLTFQNHRVYAPRIPRPRRHYRVPCQIQLVEVTISLNLQCRRHYCSSNTSVALFPEHDQVTLRFDREILIDHDLAYETLGGMLSQLKFRVDINSVRPVIDEIIEIGLDVGYLNRKLRVIPIEAKIYGTFVEHVNLWELFLRGALSERDFLRIQEEILVRRALAESARESNYGMIPAEKSSVKKMLKRVRVETEEGEAEEKEEGEGESKKRRVDKSCVICMEDFKEGYKACQMPCFHAFHGSCIKKWLDQSHYCPVCRFEMPTSKT